MEYRTEHIISINMGINFFLHLYNKMGMKSFHEFSRLHFGKDWERMEGSLWEFVQDSGSIGLFTDRNKALIYLLI